MTWNPGAQRTPLSVNYQPGGNSPRLIILHIMQGSLTGTDSWFRQSRSQVSAHFGIPKQGRAVQWVSTNDQAWHAAAANPYSIGVECEGYAVDRLTASQVTQAAAICAWAHKAHGIPLQVCDTTSGHGLAWHGLGGTAWGNHPGCPGPAIVAQRPAIIEAAKGTAMSATGPEHWDDADWEAVRRQLLRGVLAHAGNDYQRNLGDGEAADVHAAHLGLQALIRETVTAVLGRQAGGTG